MILAPKHFYKYLSIFRYKQKKEKKKKYSKGIFGSKIKEKNANSKIISTNFLGFLTVISLNFKY